MIAVCIATYNHERFIAQCLDSVLMQQCDEPIRIYVGDDASTDATEVICQQYASRDARIVYLRRTKNLGLTDNTLDIYRRILADMCDYIAMLDGDDFWTEPKKLQLQVDYMRRYPEVGFVHTNGRTLSGADTWTFEQTHGAYGINGASFANCTVLFRSNLLSENLIATIATQHFLWLDYPLYGVFYLRTKWAYLPQKTAVWRDHTSISQPQTAKAILHLREERCRMLQWLDTQFSGQVGYSAEEVENYLFEQRLNLIYQFNDKTLITPQLEKAYKPASWKQQLKFKGLRNATIYTILQKTHKKFAQLKKKLYFCSRFDEIVLKA